MSQTSTTAAVQLQTKVRIQSIDIVRGVIMIIMALDHTRDFFHNAGINSDPTDMATTTPILFFTRWITHYCAPNFVFLSGISAFLAGTRRTKGELSGFLIKRGLWLILVEVVLLSLAFSANPLYNAIILQVLWAIGFSMVILGLLCRLPLKTIAVIGAVIVLGHNILDYVKLPTNGLAGALDNIFLICRGTVIPLGHNHVIFDLYAVIPWTGCMLLGYAFGSIFAGGFDAARRKKILLYTGLAAVAAFIILRFINQYGDPAPWSVQRNGVYTFMSFLNVTKYPPSLMYLLMTIGPALLILAYIEQVKNKLTSIFIVYGSVPFLYYVMHFYLLRVMSIIVFFVSGYKTSQIITPGVPFLFEPPGYGFSLGGVYLTWLFVVVVLYFPCRWFSSYKKTHKQWWLSYL